MEVETSEGGTEIVGEIQGGGKNGSKINVADRLERRPVQVAVPAKSRVDVNAHGFWKRRSTAMFDIIISNLNAGSYLHMMPNKDL